MEQSNVIQRIRQDAKKVTESADDVHIDDKAIDTVVEQLVPEELKKLSSVVSFPLKFASIEEEVNFLSVVDILNIGSGFRNPLHKAVGRGAYDTICFGLLGMHITGNKIDAQFMVNFSIHQIQTFFGFPISEEKEVRPALRMDVPNELRPLGDHLVKIMNQTGLVLMNHACSNLGEFVVKTLKDSKDHTAASFVEKLVKTFPAFNDVAKHKGSDILIIKKAQLLAADLYRRFKDQDPIFNFPDIHELTVFADNVVPAVLRKLGVLKFSESLAQHIDAEKVLPVSDRETEIRAVSIIACDRIVERIKEKRPELDVDAAKLDYYLWTLGKKDDTFRKFHRHYTTDTMFY